VNDAEEIFPLEQILRQRPVLSDLDLAAVLAKLWRDILHVQQLIDLRFGLDRQLLFASVDAPLGDFQPAVLRQAAKSDVMCLGAGEVMQSRGVVLIRQHPQVGLEVIR
jgi:hypothetical protein